MHEGIIGEPITEKNNTSYIFTHFILKKGRTKILWDIFSFLFFAF
jgi:hypothetical protein